MTRFRTVSVALLTCATLTSGCYRYDAITSLTPTTEGVLRVELTDGGTANLAGAVGPSVVALEGRAVQQDGARFTLAVTASHTRDRQTREWHGEPVQIAFADVAHFSQRRFDTKRTVLTAAGIIGGAGFMARAFGVSVGGSGGASRGGSGSAR